jgi:predicted esterase
MNSLISSLVFLVVFQVLCVHSSVISDLPVLNINFNQSSLSGISAGAAMALQLHVVYSSAFAGAAIFAGVPYDCAAGNMLIALTACMSAFPVQPSATWSVSQAEARAALGLVEPTSNLSKQRVFLFSGIQDFVVHRLVMDTVQSFYSEYITAPGAIQYETELQAGHTVPTDDKNNTLPCTSTKSPFISYCNYDGAGIALQHIYNNQLNPKNNGSSSGKLIEFDQSPFIPSGMSAGQISMHKTGFAYVPSSCFSSSSVCRIHVSLHGCEQTVNHVGLDYVLDTGFNKWADTNNIIMLYPQAISDLTNPQGCWNWWGYNLNPLNYDTNQGYQVIAIMNMMKQLAGRK